MKGTRQAAVVLAISMMLVACGQEGRETVPGDLSPAVDAGTLPDPVEETDTASLHQRATHALAERRMVSPAGDNAVEYYLAARRQEGGAGRAHAALLELQPYLLIAVEQALARGDAPEADRLLSLVSRTDAHAPALPRLNAALADLRRGLEEGARRATEAESMPAAPASTAALPTATAASTPPPSPPMPVVPAMPPLLQVAGTSLEEKEAPDLDAATAGVPQGAPPGRVDAPATPRPATARLPRLLQDVPPRYPLPALRARMEGQVEVAFTIQPDGSVRDVQLVSSTPSGMFDASAMAVAQRWRFEATGQAHVSRRTVLFRLPAGDAGGG